MLESWAAAGLEPTLDAFMSSLLCGRNNSRDTGYRKPANPSPSGTDENFEATFYASRILINCSGSTRKPSLVATRDAQYSALRITYSMTWRLVIKGPRPFGLVLASTRCR